MRRIWVTCWAAVALAGCATTTGIVPVGPDTYFVSEMRAPVRGGGAEARRFVLAEATWFCQQQGRVFVPVTLRPDGDPFTPYYPTAFDATFQCLPAADLAGAQGNGANDAAAANSLRKE
jgi:hypothetical protein